MTNTSYDMMKAADIARLQGRTIGYVAGAYSNAYTSCIAAPTIEVLNQNGYSVYQDENGRVHVVQDRDTKGGTIWTSDALNCTFDCTGDTLQITPKDGGEETPESGTGTGETGNTTGGAAAGASQGNTTGTNANTSNLTSTADVINDDFYNKGLAALNKLNQSLKTDTSYSDLGDLTVDQAVDPLTGQAIDKAKSESIDALLAKQSVQYKFDNIAELINKTHDAQSKAKTVSSSGVGTAVGGAVAGAATGAAVGAIFGPVGALVGGVIGAIGGGITGGAVASSDAENAKKANENAEAESQAAAQELNTALEELLKEGNEEEFIAFERYYYEKTGVELADVLKALEVDENDSDIAQASGIDKAYISDMLTRIDEQNEYLVPEEPEEVETKQYSTSDQMRIARKQTEIEACQAAWAQSLQTGKATFNGKEMTSEELENYIDQLEAELAELM